MAEAYYAYGTTLAGLANIESVTRIPPFTNETNAARLVGRVGTRLGSGGWRWDGALTGALTWDVLDREAYDALIIALFGNYTTSRARLYFTVIDEAGRYSPFLFHVDRPVSGAYVNYGSVTELELVLFGGVLQSSIKTSNYTMTASDRLVYGSTAGGSVTLTLPAASAVAVDTVVSAEKLGAANTLTIQRGGSDTINGGTTSLTLTANASRYDLYSDGVSAWKTLPYP